MVPDLLIGNFKTQRFDVELLCPLQILEVDFNTDESRLNPLHKILSGFEYSAAAASEELVWTAESNVFGWTSLLGVPAGSPKIPAGSVPARVENLAGLPPAFIVVGAIDLFVEEDIEYARRLIAAGVPTELHVVPGAYHAYDLLVPKAEVTVRFTEYWTTALRRALARG